MYAQEELLYQRLVSHLLMVRCKNTSQGHWIMAKPGEDRHRLPNSSVGRALEA